MRAATKGARHSNAGAARGSKRLLANAAIVADSGNRSLPVAAPGINLGST